MILARRAVGNRTSSSEKQNECSFILQINFWLWLLEESLPAQGICEVVHADGMKGEVGFERPGVLEKKESEQNSGFQKVRRQLTAAPEVTCYRCFLPDLAGFTELRCAGPAPEYR